MRAMIGVGMLWLGLAAMSPSYGRAQQAATTSEPASVPPPSAVKPAFDAEDDRVGAIVGGVVGAAAGVGLMSLIYLAMEPDEPSASQVELHGPGGEGGYEELGRVLVVVGLGIPVVVGTTMLGIAVGTSAAQDAPAKTSRPKPVDRSVRVTPLAAISPDGGYLGARLTF